MGFSQATKYSKNLQILSVFGKVISHPERILIICKLIEGGPKTVNELSNISLPYRPTISQHIRILRDCDLITYQEKPPYIYYAVDYENFSVMFKELKAFIATVDM